MAPITEIGIPFYFTCDDIENTAIMSTNGLIHYRVDTTERDKLGQHTTRITRPPGSDTGDDHTVAEIKWGHGRLGMHGSVQSHIFDGRQTKIPVRMFMWKMGRYCSPTRYFLGTDNEDYKWRLHKDRRNYVLIHCLTKGEVARFVQEDVNEGFFRGQKLWCLVVQPTTLDIDMIILTFFIMEKKRRDSVTKDIMKGVYRHEYTPEERARFTKSTCIWDKYY